MESLDRGQKRGDLKLGRVGFIRDPKGLCLPPILRSEERRMNLRSVERTDTAVRWCPKESWAEFVAGKHGYSYDGTA